MAYQYYEDYPIQIYKGNSFLKSNKKSKKVIAFDLDETLGSFADLELLWKLICKIPNINIQFNELLDIYPEFLTYLIFCIKKNYRENVINYIFILIINVQLTGQI
jgi:uncharacterized membrane protein